MLILFFAAGSFVKSVVDEVSNRKSIPAAQRAYVGSWTASDGSTLTIRADGSGNVHASGIDITNGTVTIDEAARTLQVRLTAFGKKWTITEPPSNGRMVLDGVEFRKTGGGSSDSGGSSGAQFPASGKPDEDTAGAMATQSLTLFKQAVDGEDFTSFRAATATAFQKQFSANRLKEVFRVFLDNKGILEPIATDEPDVDEVRVVNSGLLTLSGEYPASPPLTFRLTYASEDGYWKLVSINVRRLLR